MTFALLCQMVPRCQLMNQNVRKSLDQLFEQRREHIDTGRIVNAAYDTANIRTKLYLFLNDKEILYLKKEGVI
ncbi:hypothetical protein Mpet_1422 [Methanolacinia petrolearia DSM 11571]|uniref:Uncharacterized protein n=2 Tax=Methanolacinia TaxID=230355 RepID=E1RFF2_METP4|nr:hypothetical protein Mpet_1422 [Methanolacinia petrolearia DSM 11571]